MTGGGRNVSKVSFLQLTKCITVHAQGNQAEHE